MLQEVRVWLTGLNSYQMVCTQIFVSTEFTIPEAVNLIVAVDGGCLQELGRKLGVDDIRLRRLSIYDASEHHQRLIEAWFEQDAEPSRSALLEALPQRDSAISMDSVPPTPTGSEPYGGKRTLLKHHC